MHLRAINNEYEAKLQEMLVRKEAEMARLKEQFELKMWQEMKQIERQN
jgi:hypothetical protein